jgi:ABC-type nickel/cobalt efflux system permease component RcnA
VVGGGWGRYWSETSSTMAALEVAAAMMLASAGRWVPWRSAVASAQQARGSNWLGRGQHTAKYQQWLKHQQLVGQRATHSKIPAVAEAPAPGAPD